MMVDSPFTGVVLTLNEMRNIDNCIRSLASVAREVIVVDSGSSDGTVERATGLGAKVVYHRFTTHAAQWSFALSLALEGEWVIALDADQHITPALAESLLAIARTADADTEGIYVNRLHVFRGKPLRHGGLFPKWMLKAFRKGKGFTDERELLDHRFYVRQGTVKATGLLIEDNRNEQEIAFWIDKHNRCAGRQALEELRRMRGGEGGGWAMPPRLFGTPDQRILWLKSRWYRMPRYTRPFLYFIYRYFLRAGFIDGKSGFVFHVLQAFWYRLLVDVKLDELLTRDV